MRSGSIPTSGSILTSGWCDRLEETFHGPERAPIFRRMTIGGQKYFRFIFGCCTIGADPNYARIPWRRLK